MSRSRWHAPFVVLFAALALLVTPGTARAEPTPTPSPSDTPAVPTASPTATPPAPLTFDPANARATMIAFSWTPAPGAAGYRLRIAATPGGVPLHEVSGARPAALVSGLSPNTQYWAQVLALDPAGAQLGAPSAELAVTTPYPLAAPLVQVTAKSSVSLSVSWLKPPSGTKLQLEWTAPGKKAKTTKPSGTKLVKTGLKAKTGYTVRARLLRGHTVVSAWTDPIVTTTPDGDPLRVASYNVLCANCKAWGPRRQGIANTIIDANVDVVGVQEASAAPLKGSRLSQFEDLARLLAPAGYRMTNLTRFNCRNANNYKHCRETYRGASGSVRIIYNTKTVKLISTGSRQLADLPSYGTDRFVAWAILEHKINGKRFLFTSTHLEPRNDTAGSRHYYVIRNAQARKVVQTIAAHRGKLPVIAVGDYNSTKWDVPTNGPYDIMRAAGFIDPLGNSYHSTTSTSGATVEKRINTQYSSYNAFEPNARRTDGVNGSNCDYIFTSKMRVTEWETVLKVNAQGRFEGTPPSDHNLVRATVLLP